MPRGCMNWNSGVIKHGPDFVVTLIGQVVPQLQVNRPGKYRG